MQTSTNAATLQTRKFPKFDLTRWMRTVFNPQKGEKVCILIDLDNPSDVINFRFLEYENLPIQRKAHDLFYQQIRKEVMQQFQLKACDFYAYETTKGSNLELPKTAIAPNGTKVNFEKDLYPNYDIFLCISCYSATAPLTAAAKRFGFRGATMHGLNDTILKSGLAVDYNEVSKETEKLRLGMTGADSVDIDFEFDHRNYHLFINLGRQEAQKSHGICHTGGDIANMPAGEVYFTPNDATGSFPIKFEDGTIGLMQVDQCRVDTVTLLKGNQDVIDELQLKLDSDPATGLLGELGFGTQVLPYSGADIQDEKIFGTFHVATGRNDHLNGMVTPDRFVNKKNATHEDILFSSTKTPEIHVKRVRMKRHGKMETLIENYEACPYLWNLIKK